MRSTPRPSSVRAFRGVRPRRDFQALEARRRAAARLFRQAKPQAEVARRLKVSRQSVSRWQRDWRRGGLRALRAAGRAGRPPRLSSRQQQQVQQALLRGAQAYGFATDLWTLARIATVMERVSGVRYHPGHVWRILQGFGWSLQKPARRAVERDEGAIRGWVKTSWARVKKRQTAPCLDRFRR